MEMLYILRLFGCLSILTTINSLPTGKCSYSKFRKQFQCANEHLQEIPYHLLTDRYFESLDMILNNLTVLSTAGFAQLHYKDSVKKMYFFNNTIERIEPNSFGELPNLETLEMSFNKLKHIGNEFHLAQNLINLDLSFNPIESISEDAFRGLKHLEFLSLRNCKITQLPINFLRGSQITELNLAGNYIENFDQVYLPPTLVKLDPPEAGRSMTTEDFRRKINQKNAKGGGKNVQIDFIAITVVLFLVVVLQC